MVSHPFTSNPGCMSQEQISELHAALKQAANDPSLLCDLEGCGPVAELEAEFARVCGADHALAVPSGTAAIHAALLAAGVGPGDEVFVTPYSWPQSVSPVLFTGATPVFADIDAGTFNLDPASVAERISPKTKAIVVVHLFGHMADIPRLKTLAKEAGAILISDAAHALGAGLQGKPPGAWEDIACFSFSRGKLISAGEGGMLITNNRQLYERAVALTQHPDRIRRVAGRSVQTLRLNYRLSPILALLALAELRAMDRRLAHRKAVFQAFWQGLGPNGLLSPQAVLAGEDHAAYGLPMTFNAGHGRETLCLQAQEHGIPLRCGPVGTPLHLCLNHGSLPPAPHHPTQEPGACPVAKSRCQQSELFALSALDMDSLSSQEAFAMGSVLQKVTSNL